MSIVKATATYTPRGDMGRFIETVVRPAAREGAGAAADYVLGVAKGIVAVNTGELRASGKTAIVDTPKTVVAEIAFTAPYAGFVEYGTGIAGAASPGRGPYPYNMAWPGMRAQPYLRPAIDSSRAEVMAIVKGALALRMRQ